MVSLLLTHSYWRESGPCGRKSMCLANLLVLHCYRTEHTQACVNQPLAFHHKYLDPNHLGVYPYGVISLTVKAVFVSKEDSDVFCSSSVMRRINDHRRWSIYQFIALGYCAGWNWFWCSTESSMDWRCQCSIIRLRNVGIRSYFFVFLSHSSCPCHMWLLLNESVLVCSYGCFLVWFSDLIRLGFNNPVFIRLYIIHRAANTSSRKSQTDCFGVLFARSVAEM